MADRKARGRPSRSERDGRPALSPAAARREAARKESWRSPHAQRFAAAAGTDESDAERKAWDARVERPLAEIAALLRSRLPRR
jgi:hypothetical protein